MAALLSWPERRVHVYGASPFWAYLHLGPTREEARAARPQLSTAAFYAEPDTETLRYVKLVRLKPGPLRFSA